MKVSLEGYGNRYATLAGAAGLEGKPVAITGENTVAQAASGAGLAGVAIHCREGLVLVQTHGCVTLPYTGNAPGYGYGLLAGDGAGGVKTATTGRPALVTGVDATGLTVTAILL